MNKLKAIYIILVVALLYWIIKPVECFFHATIKSWFMDLGYFKDLFVDRWKTVPHPTDYLLLAKELWNEN